MPKVSIIIPVYKVEDYLEECVDSVLAQTFEDYEVILVDDGSPDNCGAICDSYAEKDSRIHVIHKENGGVSSARNAGLDMASGDYICFVDSDDLVRPKLLETVVPLMDEGYGLVAFNNGEFPYEFINVPRIESPKTYEFHTDEERYEFILTVFLRCKLRWEAWNRVFSRALIERNGLRFEDNRMIFGEDLCFSLYYLPFVDRIRAIPDVLYDYRHRDESIMGENIGKVNLVRTARLAQFLEAFYRSKEAGRYLAEHYPPVFFMIVKGDLRRLDHSRIKKRQSCEAIREKLRGELPDWAYFEENVRAILKDREAFHRYIGYMTRWNELAEYYFAYTLCMPRSLRRTFVEAIYHILSVPVYLKYQLNERKKRRQ